MPRVVKDRPESGIDPAIRLAERERMAALGTLSAGVAHEINNPLTYVKILVGKLASMELARPPDVGSEQRLEIVQDIREGMRRIEQVVRGLRAFAQLDDEDAGPSDVHVALEAALRMSGHEIQHRARLSRDYTEVPLVVGDIARLSQVFLHLLVNAAQAIPEGAPQRHRLRVATRKAEDGRVVVEVSDTGEGIEPGLLGRIFEPFFTTRDVGEGTGMGLAVCRGIVSGLGGDIAVHSRVGHGSTFVVSLLASDGSIARGTHEPVRARGSFARPPRVLVVDRDRHAASVAATVLGELHDVAVAGSGREALTVLRREHDIDVVVCRLAMPEMNGMELYETVGTLRRELRDRFVFVAGSADESAVPEAREFFNHVGAPLLSSPIPHTALLEAVARVLRDAAAEASTPAGADDPAGEARVSGPWSGRPPRGTRVPSP